MAAVDNSATAWARMLIANGADPKLIEAWIRHEVALNPLAFRALMTPDEIAAVQLRVMAGQVRVAFTAVTDAFRSVAAAVNTASRNLNDLNGVQR